MVPTDPKPKNPATGPRRKRATRPAAKPAAGASVARRKKVTKKVTKKTTNKKSSKGSSTGHIVASIKKRLGAKSTTKVHVLGGDGAEEALSEVREWIPTGFPDLDRVLGGGWAVGRASEVYGDEGCGKTALLHKAIKSCQDQGGIAALFDFEVALDAAKMENVGIDPDRLIYLAPETAEEGWEAVWGIIDDLKTHAPDAPFFIGWDSIAASVPKAELEGKMDESAVGAHARIFSKGCRKMFREIAKVRAHIMWINQNRSKIGGFTGWGGPQTDTTGGRAVKYAASQRVANKVVKRLKHSTEPGSEPYAYLVKTVTDKSRLSPPHRSTEWVLDFTYGPSEEQTMLHLLSEANLVRSAGPGQLRGPWLPKGVKFRKRRWMEFLEDHPEHLEAARSALGDVIEAGGLREYLKGRRKADPEDEDPEED